MSYNKKQIQPLIDKYNINTQDDLFKETIKLFDGQPNYQAWAVKMLFTKKIKFEDLILIHEWIKHNKTQINKLEKGNIVSYDTKTAITQLKKEMKGLDKYNFVKKSISKFNTFQRGILYNAIMPKCNTPLEYNSHKTLKSWYDIFQSFDKRAKVFKERFYSNCSAIKDEKSLLQNIKDSLSETYDWDKCDLIAYMEKNAKDCKVVFDKDNVVIVQVPSYSSSRKLCGGGRTRWCICNSPRRFSNYSNGVTSWQYFLFDFSKDEGSKLSHVGFTVENNIGISAAHDCNNDNILRYPKENDDIRTILTKVGAKMSLFVDLRGKNANSWNREEIMKLLNESCKVLYDKDNRLIVEVHYASTFETLIYGTFISPFNFPMHVEDKGTLLCLDFNLPFNDENSIHAISYVINTNQSKKNEITHIEDAYGVPCMDTDYFEKVGIDLEEFIKTDEPSVSLLLNKFISEENEDGAIEFINEHNNEINVNFEWKGRAPIFWTVNHFMTRLFKVMIEHPTFNPKVEDGFGDKLLQSLLYVYGFYHDMAQTNTEKVLKLKEMINIILTSNVFDFNDHDFKDNTPLHVSCLNKTETWVTKTLVHNDLVDVNAENENGDTPLTNCIKNDNLKALSILSQRDDLKIRAKDRNLAAKKGIDLDKYINDSKMMKITKEMITYGTDKQ